MNFEKMRTFSKHSTIYHPFDFAATVHGNKCTGADFLNILGPAAIAKEGLCMRSSSTVGRCHFPD